MSRRHFLIAAVFTAAMTCAGGPGAHAAYVIPKIGGGQATALMKHTDIMFDGSNVTFDIDTTVATPLLRPLTPPDAFDPAQPWSVLTGKAYNYQHAWNPGGYITLPPHSGIWIERLHYDEGLQTYLRPPQWTSGATWTEIFTTDGQRWQWAGAMQHNAYTVLDPMQSLYTANYRVYIGDATTGAPLPGYGSADVTWTWNVPTWTGGAPSTAWTDARNWIGGVPGVCNNMACCDTAVFNADPATCKTPLVDANRNLKNIVFDAGAGALTLADNGNALHLTSGGVTRTKPGVTNTQTINTPLLIEGTSYTFTSSASDNSKRLNFGGTIRGNQHVAAALTLNGGNTGNNTISGSISDGAASSLAIVKDGPGAWVLSGHNTYAGGTSIANGTLTFSNALALPAASNVTTTGTGVVVFSSGYAGPITGSAAAGVAPVPEPGTLALLAAAALCGLGARRRRKSCLPHKFNTDNTPA